MQYRIEAQAAYVLHSRPYRDTSLLVDLLTLEHGKVSVVAKGARRPRSRLRAALQPFTPVQICWQGRNELKTLLSAEAVALNMNLQGRALLAGLYLNELLQRLLQPLDPHPHLFVFYQNALNELQQADSRFRQDKVLRTFELRLIDQLGYGVEPPAEARCWYRYDTEAGFVALQGFPEAGWDTCFSGQQLQAIMREDYSVPNRVQAAQYLTQQLLEPLLGSKPLSSQGLLCRPRKPVESELNRSTDKE